MIHKQFKSQFFCIVNIVIVCEQMYKTPVLIVSMGKTSQKRTIDEALTRADWNQIFTYKRNLYGN